MYSGYFELLVKLIQLKTFHVFQPTQLLFPY